MPQQKLPAEFLELIAKIKNKRAKIVIDHIIDNGQVTTEELESLYGYKHPPRAARDVREAGIPLDTVTVKSTNGKNIGAYKFGDLTNISSGRLRGRLNWPKDFKAQLLFTYGSKDNISNAVLDAKVLQIDHRIPYQISGDSDDRALDVKDFMLLSGTSNRAKSWSCESCQNWLEINDPQICKGCYWAFPESYVHVAMREIRRLELTWQEDEVQEYDSYLALAEKARVELPEYVKQILKSYK